MVDSMRIRASVYVLLAILLLGVALVAGFSRGGGAQEVAASRPMPVRFDCAATPGDELEERFCSELMHSLAESGDITLAYNAAAPHLHFIVVPSAKDG